MRTVAFLLSLGVMGTAVVAEERENDRPERHRNHVGVFASGATTNLHYEYTSYTLGADYERRLHPRLGVGALTDFIFSAERETIVAGSLVVHPGRELRVWFAPGVLIAEESSKKPFVARFGVGYDIELGRSVMSPIFNLDVIEGHVSLVYGVGLGFGF